MRDDFIAIAGHELRTPLTALRLQIEGETSRAVARDLAPERARERLDRALTNADRLGKLIEGLLDVSRIASDGLVLKRQPVDLARLILEAMDRTREQIEKGGYTVSFWAAAALRRRAGRAAPGRAGQQSGSPTPSRSAAAPAKSTSACARIMTARP